LLRTSGRVSRTPSPWCHTPVSFAKCAVEPHRGSRRPSDRDRILNETEAARRLESSAEFQRRIIAYCVTGLTCPAVEPSDRNKSFVPATGRECDAGQAATVALSQDHLWMTESHA